MRETTLTPKSVRIAEDEAKWLSAAATKGAVTQNDLLRLALHRLRKDLGTANRIKPDAVLAAAKASKYKLTPPRAAAPKALSASKQPSPASGNVTTPPAKAAPRARAKRADRLSARSDPRRVAGASDGCADDAGAQQTTVHLAASTLELDSRSSSDTRPPAAVMICRSASAAT
jgi:hypothetical protein